MRVWSRGFMRRGTVGFSSARHSIFILILVCSLLLGCAGGVDPKTLDLADEARRTFDSAYVMVKAEGEFIEGRMSDDFVQRKLASLKKKRPTVVFAHGCAGLGRGNLRYMRLLAWAGYAVVAPDSFARRYRPETCDPSRHRGIQGAPHRRVGRMRQEEIHHAAYRVRRIHWADKKNLFLMGHSQGGTAVASYEGDGFGPTSSRAPPAGAAFGRQTGRPSWPCTQRTTRGGGTGPPILACARPGRGA